MKICAYPRKLRAIFRIFLTAPRCAVSPEAQMTADRCSGTLWAAGCGCDTDWRQLDRVKKLLRVASWPLVRLRQMTALAPETGRWVIPGLTSQIDPKLSFTALPSSPGIKIWDMCEQLHTFGFPHPLKFTVRRPLPYWWSSSLRQMDDARMGSARFKVRSPS